MNLGNKKILIIILSIFSLNFLNANEKITTTPLINIEKVTPSFEEIEEEDENVFSRQKLKEKKKFCIFKIISSNTNWSR